MRERLYGHCLVAEIKKYPSKVIRKDSAKKIAKKLRVKSFIKLIKDKKVTATKEAKKRLEERFKTGKKRFIFYINV
ncbi:hypothetical protein JRO89_XS10G0054600 [Xanthoceras sorbifolium]|uniref:Uncharacterized protein n=1 Tax=Xanthoceras sorbifolium TaxID=99658 RepID=A0ABQ8HHQ8_9ROSI|nr:hypothetical protein JRO89_XS10G0054600 [Xanthoceras sorbifolium]